MKYRREKDLYVSCYGKYTINDRSIIGKNIYSVAGSDTWTIFTTNTPVQIAHSVHYTRYQGENEL